MGVCCWHQLPGILSRPETTLHRMELMATTTHTHTSMINRDYNMIIEILVINYQYSAYQKPKSSSRAQISKLGSRAIVFRVAVSPHHLGGKYRCRPHPRTTFLWETERAYQTAPHWHHLFGDNAVDNMLCFKAQFVSHIVLSKTNGELSANMIYPCLNWWVPR